jgi:hypothetical protein
VHLGFRLGPPARTAGHRSSVVGTDRGSPGLDLASPGADRASLT